MLNQHDVKFHGGMIKRVFVIYHSNGYSSPNQSTLEFIKENFNLTRNYREFSTNEPVKVLTYTSDALPRITTLKEGDACLLIGCGRLIDKESLGFAEKCFNRNIPVFFIRSNSIDVDSRRENIQIWRSTPLVTHTVDGTRYVKAPEKYFMEIPDISHIIPLKDNNDFYALLPAMVPIS